MIERRCAPLAAARAESSRHAAAHKGGFGGRVGITAHLIETVSTANAIKATIFTPGRILQELYPQAVKAAALSGHEIADHMWSNRVPGSPSWGAHACAGARDASRES